MLASNQCDQGSIQAGSDLWVEFVVGSPDPCSEGFSPGVPVLPSTKTNISKFQFDLESEGHRFIRRKTVKCYITLVKQN